MDRHKELQEENDKLRARLEVINNIFVGCKWSDAGPLAWWQPEGEKYVTRESFLAAIDQAVTQNQLEKTFIVEDFAR